MGTFTIPLKRVIELTGGSTIVDVNGLTIMTGGNIGLSSYPIFKPEYKAGLDGKIIDRYWNREIGLESISMFQLAMRRKMNEIMPYYNKLYNSELIVFDPLSTIDITSLTTGTGTQGIVSDSASNTTSNGVGSSRSVNSETPQTMLSGDADYATAASDTASVSDNTSSGTQNNTENQTSDTAGDTHTKGFQGLASDLIMRYRESLLNIDLMVLGELEELFMLIWDNGDTYTNTRGFLI